MPALLMAVFLAATPLPLAAANPPELHVPASGEYSLREWHEPDGLPHDEIARVHQDAGGFLWVATFEGLARFDSVHFENFADIFKSLAAAPNVRALAEPAGLGLVCAPADGGLIAHRDGRWERLAFAAGRQVNSLFAEADGTLWASCEDRTLLRLHAGRTEVFPVADFGSIRPIAYFATDETAHLWIATGAFLGRWENGRLEPSAAIPGNVELRIGSSRHGGPWVVTPDRIYKLTNGAADAGLAIPTLVGAHYIHTLLEDRTGALWIGTRSQGLFLLTQGRLLAVPTSSEDIRSLCEDREGNLWVGTNGGGLDRLRLRDFRLFDKTSGLLDNFSYTVCEDATGTMWFGNRDGCVARFRDDKIELPARTAHWKPFNAMSVFPDGQGKIWITSGLGIFKTDPAAQDRLTRVEPLRSIKLVRVSYVARNGDYWMTIDPTRIGRLSGDQFISFGPDEGLSGQEIRCLSEDSTGRIWAGSSDGNLFRFDGKRFQPVPLRPAEPLGPIQAICFESDDVVWIGTGGSGLGVLADGKFRIFDTRHGLPDDRITDIIRDDAGRFWFGSTSGIFSVRHAALTQLRTGKASRVQAILVGRNDNLGGLSCLGMFKPSTWKDHAGRLWFTTRKGVLTFDPATANTEVLCPPVFVSEIKFDGQSQPIATALRIGGHVRKTEFRLSVLRFTAPDRVQIRYRLQGFDNAWVLAGPDRIVSYPALPPGDYRFETASSLSNGVWNEDGVSLALVVVPLWWRSLWFYLLVCAAAITAVVLVVRTWSHRRLRQRVDRLERESTIERERTRIARDIHDDLGASLSRISLLTQSAQQDGVADRASHLGQIYNTVSEITRSMDEIVWAVNPRHDPLDSLADYLASYAQSLLAAAGIRCRLNFPPQLPAFQLNSHVRHNLYLCLKETLHNVVKHSGADEAQIAMTVASGELAITVTDNGCGFDATRPPVADPQRFSSGNGLENMRRRMDEIFGRCEIDSRPGQGTTVRVTFPFDKNSNASPA